MKILSIDVGIKNLGICLLEYDNNIINIIKWNLINIIENKNEELCIYNDCNNISNSYINYDNTKYFFCIKHLKTKNQFIYDKYKKDRWIDSCNGLCNRCSDNKNKKNIHINNECNLLLCNKHYNNIINNIEKTLDNKKIVKNNSIKNLSIDKIKELLIDCLDSNIDILLNSDMVYIENQPTFKNPMMKAISDTIYTWFLIRGIKDKLINNSILKNVKYISPLNKLKYFNNLINKNSTENIDKNYKETKNMSINYTEILLNEYKLYEWINFFKINKKKDDLADSFLQGIYILNKEFNILDNIKSNLDNYNNQ